ncbi:hypothetical protein CRM22_008488 [Opisthorchis felineus]|uniref:Uncharacterized protein n=1 Tax=Opisthorchis felineus TaxID=147828 RepID=A0A4S2LJ04_OPIFE|nr:hypothetical protein CRM22_008488 [Opisthorchis felineus]
MLSNYQQTKKTDTLICGCRDPCLLYRRVKLCWLATGTDQNPITVVWIESSLILGSSHWHIHLVYRILTSNKVGENPKELTTSRPSWDLSHRLVTNFTPRAVWLRVSGYVSMMKKL